MIRLVLPAHLRNLAQVSGEVSLQVDGPVTIDSVLDSLEAQYPMLCGTIRDHVSKKRRPFVRFFMCEEDWSHEPTDTPLPTAIATGGEPLLIVGAIAGGSAKKAVPISHKLAEAISNIKQLLIPSAANPIIGCCTFRPRERQFAAGLMRAE